MTRPGDSVEGITVPLGDPDALLGAARSLTGVAAQLQDSAGLAATAPSFVNSWCGPGSSAYAMLTGQQAAMLRDSAGSVLIAGISVRLAATDLEDAQQRAQKAIVRAKRAREEINDAKEAIREAVQAQSDARGRMDAALIAREAAEFQLFGSAVDALVGSGASQAAIDAADAAYRDAERDLREAERREARARDRLLEATEDLKAARKAGDEAAEDAEDAGLSLKLALAMVPSGVLGMPGVPAAAQISDAAGIPRPQPQHIPISEQEPPEHWPGWAKSLFKIGRGEMTVIAGTASLAKKAWDDPEKIPGAVAGVGSAAYHDPLGTGKQLVGYDLLANGQWEDWMGQNGLAALSGGAATTPARLTKLNRVVGTPNPVPLGRTVAPINSRKFAGTRFDFTKDDFGVREGNKLPKMAEENRVALAEKYPNGVRFTRSGYPVFTPYEIDRVAIGNLNGDYKHDARLANLAAGRTSTPEGYVWHHVEDGVSMELVPKDLHHAVKHTGGAADVPRAKELGIAPGGVFTPFEQNVNDFGAASGGATAVAGAQEGRP